MSGLPSLPLPLPLPPLSRRARALRRHPYIAASAAAGALLAAATLGWAAWSWVQEGRERREDGPVAPASDNNTPSSSSARAARPSLTLALPASFARTSASLAHLRLFLEALAPAFQVHLLAPPPPARADGAPAPDAGVESVARLADELAGVSGYDTRRTLEYGTHEGRMALVRAIACDAHVELFVCADDDAAPSAASSSGAIATDTYVADLERLRKSSARIVLLLLPPLASLRAPDGCATPPHMTRTQVDAIAKRLRTSQTRGAAVKLVDLRDAAEDDDEDDEARKEERWTEGARQVALLASGWR